MPKTCRYWTFIVYPESAPSNWKELLKDSLVPCAVSPLHGGDDEHAKEHHHILLGFKRGVGVGTARSICNVCGGANGVICEVFAPLGTYEYLTHKNSPDKQQFGDVEPELLNGFTIPRIQLDDEDMMTECVDLVFEYNILEFKDLCNHFRKQGQTEKANWVVRHAYGLKVLIDSIRFSHVEAVREAKDEREREEDETRRKGFKHEDFCEEKADNPFS